MGFMSVKQPKNNTAVLLGYGYNEFFQVEGGGGHACTYTNKIKLRLFLENLHKKML